MNIMAAQDFKGRIISVLILVFVDFLMNFQALLEKGSVACLNPCFRGLSHEFFHHSNKNPMSDCLNPCFRGLSHESFDVIASTMCRRES